MYQVTCCHIAKSKAKNEIEVDKGSYSINRLGVVLFMRTPDKVSSDSGHFLSNAVSLTVLGIHFFGRVGCLVYILLCIPIQTRLKVHGLKYTSLILRFFSLALHYNSLKINEEKKHTTHTDIDLLICI